MELALFVYFASIISDINSLFVGLSIFIGVFVLLISFVLITTDNPYDWDKQSATISKHSISQENTMRPLLAES